MATIRQNFSYGVVAGDSIQELADRIAAAGAQGFMPLGGIAVVGDPAIVGTFRIFQAIIRVDGPPVEEEEPRPKLVT